MGERVKDSAGVTCEYTPIEELKKGDVVIIGWRTTVDQVEVDWDRDRARVWWADAAMPPGAELGPHPDQWNPLGSPMPVKVASVSTEEMKP